MAGLKKRGKNYYIVFSKNEDGKQVKKTCSLGTTFKKIAEEKKITFQKLSEFQSKGQSLNPGTSHGIFTKKAGAIADMLCGNF